MPFTEQNVVDARDTKGFTNLVAVTPGSSELAFVPAGLMVSADCTVTMTFFPAVSVAVPLKAGVQYFLHPIKITAVSDSATCWIAKGYGQN